MIKDKEEPVMFLITPIRFTYPAPQPFIVYAEDMEGNRYELEYEVKNGLVNPYSYKQRKL